MKNWIKILTFLVAIETLLISVYCCCKLKIDANSASVLVASLGVLVTFLVAWQIWQTIDTKESLKEVGRLSGKFGSVRRELDSLHQIHEAYVLASIGEDHRLQGRSASAFEHFIGSAFIFTRDLEHYTLRLMSSISSMVTAFDDLMRPSMGERQPEIDKFINRRDTLIGELKRLRELTNGMVHSAEQANQEITSLIGKLQSLKPSFLQ